MSKSEAIHKLYESCKNINFDEADDFILKADNKDNRRLLLWQTNSNG